MLQDYPRLWRVVDYLPTGFRNKPAALPNGLVIIFRFDTITPVFVSLSLFQMKVLSILWLWI